MRPYRLIYDVSELNQLISRDLAAILYRLYGDTVTPTGLTLQAILAFWYHHELFEHHAVLFKRRPNPHNLGDSRLINALRHEIHPAYRRLLLRMVRLPVDLYAVEADALVLGKNDLTLSFDRTAVNTRELDRVHHLTYRQFGYAVDAPESTFYRTPQGYLAGLPAMSDAG